MFLLGHMCTLPGDVTGSASGSTKRAYNIYTILNACFLVRCLSSSLCYSVRYHLEWGLSNASYIFC